VSFRIEPLSVPGLALVHGTRHADARGSFEEWFRAEIAERLAPGLGFVQDNLARSRAGVVRGLHFQAPPHQQAKLVGVVDGEIFDVAVDLRRGSPTYGRWLGVRLSADESTRLFVPAGFAHGYAVTSASATVLYKVSAVHAPESEGGVAFDDPDLGITWPVADPVVSERDRGLPRLSEFDTPFTYAEDS